MRECTGERERENTLPLRVGATPARRCVTSVNPYRGGNWVADSR